MRKNVNRTKFYRILALFLTASLVISNFSGSTFAKPEDGQTIADEFNYTGTNSDSNDEKGAEGSLLNGMSGNDVSGSDVSGGDVSGGDVKDAPKKKAPLKSARAASDDKNVFVTAEGEQVIYFDLSQGQISFTNSTYTGYVLVSYDDGNGNLSAPTKKIVTGTYSDDYVYYIFQSNTASGAPDEVKGYVIRNAGESVTGVKLPEYDNTMACNCDKEHNSWADHITNETDIEKVITDWANIAQNQTKKAATSNYINVEITGKQSTMADTAVYGSKCNLVLDNVWSSYQSSDRGGLNITGAANKSGNHTQGVHVTVDLKGNNRLGRIFYYTASTGYSYKWQDVCSPSTLTLTSQDKNGTLTVIGSQDDHHGNSNYAGGQVPANNWDSVIGGSDGEDHVTGLYITGGTIYAGSMPMENCTVIGGGGNGVGQVTIRNATVTAVGHTTGTAIGGGIAHTASGGPGDILIESGKVFAYNFGQPAYWTISSSGWWSNITSTEKKASSHVPGTAIGGGGSIKINGSDGTVNISGGEVYAQSLGGSAIGGGGTCVGSGGNATVTITGGTVWAKSIADDDYQYGDISNPLLSEGEKYSIAPGVAIGGGTGGINGNGGTATVVINEDDQKTFLTAGSIGGGSTDNTKGRTGYANVTIEAGTVTGQVVMAKPGSGTDFCQFTMRGGSLGESPIEYPYTKSNGGAVWIDDPKGVALVEGGSITATNPNRNAVNGGAVYMTGGTFTLNGETAKITGWNARENGGAIYLGATGDIKGAFVLEKGTISGNSTETGLGGALYLDGGNATINNGLIQGNRALNGGGAYLNGGTLTINDGSFKENIATANGGGAYVNGGNVIMNGGSFDGNEATADGGGAYITGGDFTMNGANVLLTGNNAANGAGVYLTGGNPYLLSGTLRKNEATQNGGGIFIDKKIVNMDPLEDVTITANTAGQYGAGIYIEGTDGTDAGFTVSKTAAAKVHITGNIADIANGTGGGVCINKGFFNVDSDRITLTGNQAYNGGGVAVIGGNFTLSASEIFNNTAYNLGGGVMVDGGNAIFTGGILQPGGEDTGCGSIIHNTAEKGGGGIAVRNGNVTMSAGIIDENTVNNGSGGGIYVESESSNVSVMVYSGYIRNNKAIGGDGGAVAVLGQEESTEEITVQIGVNKGHVSDGNGGFVYFEHKEGGTDYYHTACPILAENNAGRTGGACYITGSATTKLNVFCLKETGNIADGDSDINNIHLSDFMMVAGGKVIISTSAETYEGVRPEETGGHGFASIENSIHITGGELDLYGTMVNPQIVSRITVDIEQGEGSFEDHRYSQGYVKLLYNENFKDPVTQKEDYTITAYQVKHGDTVVISKNLYGHPGYTILGWYTKPNRLDPDGIRYDTEDVYKFYVAGTPDQDIDSNFKPQVGDLTLYAIWEVHGYYIAFYPNTQGQSHDGEMNTISLNYDQGMNLPQNTYKWPGHVFLNWNTKPDGTGTTYTDEQWVSMLTTENGETIKLYAQWDVCEHPHNLKGDGTYSVTYTVNTISASKKTIIKTCDCGYTSEIDFSAKDGKYDGTTSFPAGLTAKSSEWTLNEADITYSAVKIDDDSLPLDPKVPWDAAQTINAGYYTASIQLDKSTGLKPQAGANAENIMTVSVNYTVHKKEQPAPSKPYFVNVKDASSNTLLKVTLLETSALNTQPEYVMEFFENGAMDRSEWKDNDTAAQDGYVYFPVSATYTTYYIYARYKGTDNYKTSPETKSNSYFYYEGDTDIYVDAEDGIKSDLIKVDGGVTLKVYPDSERGFYINNRTEISYIEIECVNKNNEVNDKIIKLDDQAITKLSPLEEHTYTIKDIPANNIITIRLRGARKIPQITSYIEEGQVYDEVTGSSAVISNDSAYTVSYQVTAYDSADYATPVLAFDRKLPFDTNLIMKDMTDNSYWYYPIPAGSGDENTAVAITEFIKMGSRNVPYANPDVTYTDLHLQFVVDFSEDTAEPGDIVSTLQIAKLLNSNGDPVSNAPDLMDKVKYPKAEASAAAAVSSFSINKKSGVELEEILTYQYSAGGEASKWIYRQAVLTLTVDPDTPVPQDAILYVRVGNTWSYIHRVIDNGTVKYLVPLGTLNTDLNEVILQLQSSMLPAHTATYHMTAQLGMAMSIAESAGLNAEPLGDHVSLDFTNTTFEPAVKISWDGSNEEATTSTPEQHIFQNGESMQLMVDYKDLPTEGNLYEIKTSVLQQTINEDGSETYLDTAVHPRLTIQERDFVDNDLFIKASCQVAFNNYSSGNYCFVVMVTRGGYTILEVPYYFIIKDPDNNNGDKTVGINDASGAN